MRVSGACPESPRIHSTSNWFSINSTNTAAACCQRGNMRSCRCSFSVMKAISVLAMACEPSSDPNSTSWMKPSNQPVPTPTRVGVAMHQ